VFAEGQKKKGRKEANFHSLSLLLSNPPEENFNFWPIRGTKDDRRTGVMNRAGMKNPWVGEGKYFGEFYSEKDVDGG
jgi:hypothetical protein